VRWWGAMVHPGAVQQGWLILSSVTTQTRLFASKTRQIAF
jgi:hypothetical protein